jgi:hypothetical protein
MMSKRFVSIFICILIILSICTSAYGFDVTFNMSKQEFAEYIENNASMNSSQSSTVTLTAEEKDLFLLEAFKGGFDEVEQHQLEEMGIHLYKYNNNKDEIVIMGEPSDVNQEVPAVAYDEVDDEWIVTAGGKWTDVSWVNPGDVGGYEMVGFNFAYSNIGSLPLSNLPRYTSIIGSLLDPSSGKRVLNYDDCLGDETAGIAVQMQDYGTLSGGYVGKNYAVVVRYDYRFTYVDGSVRGFYVHTDDDVSITEFTITGDSSKLIGLDVTFSIEDGGFTEYSSRKDL